MRHLNILRPWWRSHPGASGGGLGDRWRHHQQILLDHFGVVAGVLLLFCAMIWAAGEHARQQAGLRLAETNRHVAAFHAPPVGDAWRHLTVVWHAQRDRQSTLLRRIAPLSGAPLQAELGNYRAFVIDTVEEHALAADIATVVGFYRQLATCIRIGSCDATLAAGRFGSAAWSFRNQHYYYLQEEYEVDEIDRVIDAIAPRTVTPAPSTMS
jgi:hypothetical protein